MRRIFFANLVFGSAMVLAMLLTTAAVAAQEFSTVGFGAGIFDTAAFTDEGDFDALEAGLVWHGPATHAWGLGPMAGISGNEDGAWWVYLGARRPFRLRGCWEVGLNFGPAYYEQGDSKELGNDVEFRSGLELTCRRSGGSAIGMEFYHLSNAGLAETNPGINSLWVVFSVPLGR